MAYEVDYDDLDYGDETRGEGLQTVGLPHGAPEDGSSGPVEGMVVAFDGSEIEAADSDGDGGEFGVLYTYKYFGDSSHDGPYIREDRNATVAVGGKLKVHVDSDVSAGDTLEAADSSGGGDDDVAGVLTTSSDDSANFVALSDAKKQGKRPNDSDAYYAEVLVR